MESCKQASELANSIVYNAILIAVIITSATAIIVEIWVIFKTTNRILLHQNARILIITHQLWLILHCAARIFAHTYVLLAYRRVRVDNPCGYMLFVWECFMMRAPIVLSSSLNSASIPSIVAERIIATFFSSKYEKFGKKVAVIFIIIEVVLGIGTFAFMFGDFTLPYSKRVHHCPKAWPERATRISMVLGLHALIDFISVLVIPVLLYVNKRFHRNKIHVNLSDRYQITENINSLRTLLRMFTFHSLFRGLHLVAVSMFFAFRLKSSVGNAIYLEGLQLTPLYALTLPIAIVWTEKHVRKTAQENCRKAMELKGNEAANHYFTIFERPAGRMLKD
ncbi:T-cell receptor beta chain ANA 11, putative [Brugia malayi]|uniref:Bm9596 n=1 Tax=Brugia malayi TaxID=6279 RepID=A0A4E9F1R3_BRUMA|nr:T-cell receptor beta chain ANA 11, putative [Brugia malayi]VIO89967.1 T-cell receptor beta chain ANA 11, putative [Brugia malayi]